MTHCLNGKNYLNINSLKGITIHQNQEIPIKIRKLKEKILDNFVVPIFTKKWNTLNENQYFIENIQKNINYYYETYKLDELTIYVELIKVIKMLIENNQTLQNYENNMTTDLNTNEIVSLIFKTTKIRLLPEYEIYDNIIGKPKKELNQTYKEDVISIIKKLLEQENMTYFKIKEYITKNYDVTF